MVFNPFLKNNTRIVMFNYLLLLVKLESFVTQYYYLTQARGLHGRLHSWPPVPSDLVPS